MFSKVSAVTSTVSTTPSDITDMLSRPQLIGHYNNSFLLDGLIHRIELQDYFNNTFIRKKLVGFNYLRADINIRINISAPPYGYGAIVASYCYGDHNGAPPDPVVDITSRNKEYIDISQCQSLEMTIPYCHPYDYYDISDLTNSGLSKNYFPTLLLARVTPILDASTAGNLQYTWNVYMWLSNIHLSTPTLFNTESSKREKKEVKQPGQVTTVATAFEKGLSSISSVPIIGPFAATGAMVAKGVATIASALGFSRPRSGDLHTAVGYTPFMITQGEDQVRILTSDPNNTTDLSKYDDIDGDSLAARNLLCRSSAVTSGAVSAAPGFAIPVTPFVLGAQAGSPGSPSYAVSLNILSAVSLTHRYWSGSLIYTYRFFASKYHRTRVRISWVPYYYPSDDAEYALRTQNTLVEITGSTTVEICVKWGSNRPYLPIYPCNLADPQPGFDNGYLSMALAEPVVAPDPGADIFYVVEVRAGEDFDLMLPTTTFLQNFHTVPRANATTLKTTISPLKASVTHPVTLSNMQSLVQADDIYVLGSVESGKVMETQTSVHTVVQHTFNEGSEIMPSKYHGERFTSFRTLLKRKQFTSVEFANISLSSIITSRFVCSMPIGDTPIIQSGSASCFTYNQPNFISYLSRFYRGWHGSMRLAAAFTRFVPYDPETYQAQDVAVIRSAQVPLSAEHFNIDEERTTDVEDYALVYRSYARYGDGVEFFKVDKGQVVNVEVPWSMNANWITNSPIATDRTYPGIIIMFGGDVNAKMFHSIGEDFNFTQFLGIPPMYIYNVLDVTPIG